MNSCQLIGNLIFIPKGSRGILKNVRLLSLTRLLSKEVKGMTKIELIVCYGRNIEIWYFPKDLTLQRWENFLENHSRGNEAFIKFEEKDGRTITINPSQWGSVSVEVYKHD